MNFMSSQQWDPESYERNARFVSDHGADVVDLLAPKPGERILDLGCGDGALTEKLAASGCAVVGIDASIEQVAGARRRGLDARVGSAERLDFDGEFDAVFSNAVLHWVRDQDAALDGVRRALKPGGRFVGEFGGAGNIAVIRAGLAQAFMRRGLDPDAVDPWFFPTPEEYGRLLAAHFFRVRHLRLFPRKTPLPAAIAEWLETFAQPFLVPFEGEDRRQMVEEIAESVRPELYEPGKGWFADYVRIRFEAFKV